MNIMLDRGAYAPAYAHITDAGADIRSPYTFLLPARSSKVVDTGLHIELPMCTVGMLKSKSGLNVKHGIISEGVIDEGYTGSIKVKLYNLSDEPYYIEQGDKITQLVILPVCHAEFKQVDSFAATERGNGGFGSTGK